MWELDHKGIDAFELWCWGRLLRIPWTARRSNQSILKEMLLLLSHFSRVQLCATPWTAAHQAPLSQEFSRQEHWSGFPFPSPMHESEKWKWSRSVVSNSLQPHGLQPTRLLCPWDFPGKSTGVGKPKKFVLLSGTKSVVSLRWYLISAYTAKAYKHQVRKAHLRDSEGLVSLVGS